MDELRVARCQKCARTNYATHDDVSNTIARGMTPSDSRQAFVSRSFIYVVSFAVSFYVAFSV